jgi:hypothetical protein
LSAYTVHSSEWAASRAKAFNQRYRQGGLNGVLGDLLDETSGAAKIPGQAHNRATWFMLLGKHEAALSELEAGVASESPPFNLIYLRVDPLFDAIRQQPRFQRILNKIAISR